MADPETGPDGPPTLIELPTPRAAALLERREREPDARPLLVPIAIGFGLALALAPFAPIASAVVFFSAGYGTIGYGILRSRWRRPRKELPELPAATLRPPRD